MSSSARQLGQHGQHQQGANSTGLSSSRWCPNTTPGSSARRQGTRSGNAIDTTRQIDRLGPSSEDWRSTQRPVGGTAERHSTVNQGHRRVQQESRGQQLSPDQIAARLNSVLQNSRVTSSQPLASPSTITLSQPTTKYPRSQRYFAGTLISGPYIKARILLVYWKSDLKNQRFVDNVEDVITIFSGEFGYEATRHELDPALGQTAIEENLLEAWRCITRDMKSGDLVVFYYCGHGRVDRIEGQQVPYFTTPTHLDDWKWKLVDAKRALFENSHTANLRCDLLWIIESCLPVGALAHTPGNALIASEIKWPGPDSEAQDGTRGAVRNEIFTFTMGLIRILRQGIKESEWYSLPVVHAMLSKQRLHWQLHANSSLRCDPRSVRDVFLMPTSEVYSRMQLTMPGLGLLGRKEWVTDYKEITLRVLVYMSDSREAITLSMLEWYDERPGLINELHVEAVLNDRPCQIIQRMMVPLFYEIFANSNHQWAVINGIMGPLPPTCEWLEDQRLKETRRNAERDG